MASRSRAPCRGSPIASSISLSLTVSGGASRSAVGVTALTTRPASRQSALIWRASMSLVELRRESRPEPRTSATPSSSASAVQ